MFYSAHRPTLLQRVHVDGLRGVDTTTVYEILDSVQVEWDIVSLVSEEDKGRERKCREERAGKKERGRRERESGIRRENTKGKGCIIIHYNWLVNANINLPRMHYETHIPSKTVPILVNMANPIAVG